MTGKPVLVASASDNVLFPDPASPVTMTRRPNANGIPSSQSVSLTCRLERAAYLPLTTTAPGRQSSAVRVQYLVVRRRAALILAALLVVAVGVFVWGAQALQPTHRQGASRKAHS